MSYEETVATIKANFKHHFIKKPNLYGMKATAHLTVYSLAMAFWFGIQGRYPYKDGHFKYSLANDSIYKIIFCEAFARLLMKHY